MLSTGGRGMVSSTTAGGSALSSNVSSVSSFASSSCLFTMLLENFTNSYDDTHEDDNKEMVKDLMEKADTDGNGSLSKDELASLKLQQGSNEAKFVNELVASFHSFDTNNDGELSIEEMQEAIKKKRFSQQELAEMAEDMSSESSENTGIDNNISSSFEQTLLGIL